MKRMHGVPGRNGWLVRADWAGRTRGLCRSYGRDPLRDAGAISARRGPRGDAGGRAPRGGQPRAAPARPAGGPRRAHRRRPRARTAPARGARLIEADMRERMRWNIETARFACGGRIYGPQGAAARLGIRPTTLSSRLKALGIHRLPSCVLRAEPRRQCSPLSGAREGTRIRPRSRSDRRRASLAEEVLGYWP